MFSGRFSQICVLEAAFLTKDLFRFSDCHSDFRIAVRSSARQIDFDLFY